MLRIVIAGVLVAVGAALSAPAQAGDDHARATAFVKQRYVQGVPFEEARRLPRDSVPTLVAMLADPANEPYLGTIVVTLGIIGDPRATRPLIDLVESSAGVLSIDRFNGVLSVPTGLGHLAREGDAQALQYLLDHTSLATWKAAALRWRFGKYDGDARDVLLTKVTVNGLAASGRPEALARLEKLRDVPESPQLAAAIDSNVREGIAFNARVRTEGPQRVFGGHPGGAQ